MLFSAFQLVFVSIIAKILSFAVRIMLARELSSEAMNLYALASGVRQLKIHKSSKSDLIVAFFMSTP